MNPLPALGPIARTIGIKGFIAIGLGLALAIVMWRADAISGQRDMARLERDACFAASEANAASQKAQKLAYEAKYKELADNADEQAERAQIDAMAAADRYIRANRVRGNQSGLSTAPAAPDDNSPGSPDGAGGEALLVAVSEDDIRICTANTVRLEAARDWALSLTEATAD